MELRGRNNRQRLIIGLFAISIVAIALSTSICAYGQTSSHIAPDRTASDEVAQLYANINVILSEQGMEFGSSYANSLNKNDHYNWAKVQKIQTLEEETVRKIMIVEGNKDKFLNMYADVSLALAQTGIFAGGAASLNRNDHYNWALDNVNYAGSTAGVGDSLISKIYTAYEDTAVRARIDAPPSAPTPTPTPRYPEPPKPEPFPWQIIPAALILLLVGGYFFTRSNLQLLPKEKTLPCDGKSTMPIKVQFVNGLGSLKKQGSDCDVEMKTTFGKIDNVVVPAGKISAEAVLTSSNDSGPVTVTARSGGRTASAQLQFMANEAALDLETDKSEIPADNKSQATVTIMVRSAEGAHITFPDDRTVELATTHGKITSPIKIPSRSLSGTATLTAGDQSGTATVTATSGSLKGEVKVVFAELEKRWCMRCGAPMKLDAERCAKCGKTPPSHIDTKQCPTCETVLPKNAGYCEKCGAMQSDIDQAKKQ